MGKMVRRREFTLCPSLNIVVKRAGRWKFSANVDGKKKVTKKQRRSGEKDWRKRWVLVSRSGV
jgi:hypothetical protein